MTRSAVVIGAGLGGLVTAIRLRAGGVDTVLIEGRDRPGGHIGGWTQDGFTFDDGPGALPDPAAFRELWALAGFDMSADIRMLPVTPHWRFIWPDGSQFDLSDDDDQMHAQIAKLSVPDNAGWRALMDHAARMEIHRQRVDSPSSATARLNTLPDLSRNQSWRSLHGLLARFIKHPQLREALGFPAVTMGANPFDTSALWAIHHRTERDRGLWYPQGGTGKLAEVMAALFERLGGRVVLGDNVVEIETLGDRVTGVRTASGAQFPGDAVISNADAVHSYRDLIRSNRHGERAGSKLARRRHSPSFFQFHFGIRGSWPGVAHRTALMNVRHHGLMEDIFEHGVISEDIAIILHHPSVTDPRLAPEGHSVFSAQVPVPHLGRLPVDWDHIGPVIEARLIDTLGTRLIPDLAGRIVTHAVRTPVDVAQDFNAHWGSAFGVEPRRTNAGLFRLPHRDKTLPNLYFAGSATWPGPGISGVLSSAKTTADLILEDVQR